MIKGVYRSIFENGCGIAIDKQENIYVGDIRDFRIQKFSNNGTFITAWKTHGDDINETFIEPFPQAMDLAVDEEGNIFASDYGWTEELYREIQVFKNLIAMGH